LREAAAALAPPHAQPEMFAGLPEHHQPFAGLPEARQPFAGQRDNVLSSPMAAGVLMQLKAECEAQHARAEVAERERDTAQQRIRGYGGMLLEALQRFQGEQVELHAAVSIIANAMIGPTADDIEATRRVFGEAVLTPAPAPETTKDQPMIGVDVVRQ
jgi:hypothetical protein